MKSIRDPRYMKFIDHLKKIRKDRQVSQVELAEKLGQPQSYVAKVEIFERRLDLIELYDWLDALNYNREAFIRETSHLEID